MRAVIYARYSSHAQKDASIEQQLRVCRQYAREHDLQIVGEYCDHALTGTSDKRPEFLKMIRDSSKGHWQRVLVYKIDRFARNRYDSATYKARLKKNGVKVMSVMEPIPEGPEGILLESVLEGSAEYYSANLSQNILRGMHDNALACKVNNGGLPLGYVKGPDGRYAIEPTEAAVVREIFEMYANGSNVTEIIGMLNSRGLRTSRGARFNKNSLHTILRNERYAGVYIWKDVRIEGGVPAIISRELFEAELRQLPGLMWTICSPGSCSAGTAAAPWWARAAPVKAAANGTITHASSGSARRHATKSRSRRTGSRRPSCVRRVSAA